LRKTVVDSYCRDIKAGKWKLTNQGIGVTSTGVLADGQHRLMAIKECGYPPLPILIVTGLDCDVQIAVDTHAKRSQRDMLHFAFNERVSKSATAIGNLLLRISKGWTCAGSTNNELIEKIHEYFDEIETVTSTPRNSTFFAAPYLAAFCEVMKQRPNQKEEIKNFILKVEAGEMLTRRMPEFHLRNFVTLSVQSSGYSAQKERYLKTEKALTARLDGQEMGVLRI
jgi:hypothetical protein